MYFLLNPPFPVIYGESQNERVAEAEAAAPTHATPVGEASKAAATRVWEEFEKNF